MIVVLLLGVLAAAPWVLRRRAAPIAEGGTPPARGGVAGTSGRTARRRVAAARGRPATAAGPADPALLLDLVAVALAAGAPVPAALAAVGAAWQGPAGEAVLRAARALALGTPWEVAWAGAPRAARAVGDALGPSWSAGASPVPLLRAAADRSRAARRAAARTAAGRLGVRLVLPLGLCFLPAFVLLGLVPVVVSLASGLFG